MNLEWGLEREDVTWDEAKDWCESLGDGWRLPTRWELLYAYETDVEGFASDFYWSSSVCDSDYAWLQYFDNGYQNYDYKFNYIRVRAVRETNHGEPKRLTIDDPSAAVCDWVDAVNDYMGALEAELARLRTERDRLKRTLIEVEDILDAEVIRGDEV